MVKVSSESSINRYYVTYLIIGAIALTIIVLFVSIDKSNGSAEISNAESYDQPLLRKEAHLLTFKEWKTIAELRATQYYNCAKDLDYSSYLSHPMYCTEDYTRNWVEYRNNLDYKSNLTRSQIKLLQKYWMELSNETSDKIQKAMDSNDRKKRPNHYK